MEITGGLKKYLRRRRYQRLDTTGKDTRVVRLGGKRKRSWKIKAIPKLKFGFEIVSPLNLLRRIRDAYVNMMLNLEDKVSSLNGDSVFGARRIASKPMKSSGNRNKVSKAAEYDAKLILEIYKSLMASRQEASH